MSTKKDTWFASPSGDYEFDLVDVIDVHRQKREEVITGMLCDECLHVMTCHHGHTLKSTSDMAAFEEQWAEYLAKTKGDDMTNAGGS